MTRDYDSKFPFGITQARKLSGKIATVKYSSRDGEQLVTGVVKPITRLTMFVGEVIVYLRGVSSVTTEENDNGR